MRLTMRVFLYAGVVLAAAITTNTQAIPFPTMTHVEITSCKNSPLGECTDSVYYAGTSEILEMGTPVTLPTSKLVRAVGVHCARGDKSKGIPYSLCSWVIGGHAPRTTDCTLKSLSSWELTPTSTCSTAPTWGTHSGAAPGGECVMFGNFSTGDVMLLTPYGHHTAESVANGGNRFCIKPLPPGTACDVVLPPIIDHGSMVTGTRDTKYIDGKVDCGQSTVVNVVGSPNITLAPGVSTKISTSMSTATDLRIQSDMNVEASALSGDYSASVIIAVSPY
jgi:hypothetical protein